MVTTDTPPLSPEPPDSGLPAKAVLEQKPTDMYQTQIKHQAKKKKNDFSDSDIFFGSASFSDNLHGIFSGSVSDSAGNSSVTFDVTFRYNFGVGYTAKYDTKNTIKTSKQGLLSATTSETLFCCYYATNLSAMLVHRRKETLRP
ncbi:hypothetical protein RYX36_027161 [Vicia faba]